MPHGNPLKIVIATDFHLERADGSTLDKDGRPLLDGPRLSDLRTSLMSASVGAHAFIVGGDLVEGGSQSSGGLSFKDQWGAIKTWFESYAQRDPAPIFALGNHDYQSDNFAQASRDYKNSNYDPAFFGPIQAACDPGPFDDLVSMFADDRQKAHSRHTNRDEKYAFCIMYSDPYPWRLAVLQSFGPDCHKHDPTQPTKNNDHPTFSESSVKLIQDLTADPIPTVVFSHAPIVTQVPVADLSSENYMHFDNQITIDMLRKAQVRLALSGHTHHHEKFIKHDDDFPDEDIHFVNCGSVRDVYPRVNPQQNNNQKEIVRTPPVMTVVTIDDLANGKGLSSRFLSLIMVKRHTGEPYYTF